MGGGTKILVGGSRLYKMGEGSWTLRHVHCYFLTADVMWPAASSSRYVDYPAMMDYTSICKSESTARSLSYVAFFSFFTFRLITVEIDISAFWSKTQREGDAPTVLPCGALHQSLRTSGAWSLNNPGYSCKSNHGDSLEILRPGDLGMGGNTSSTFQRARQVGFAYGWWIDCRAAWIVVEGEGVRGKEVGGAGRNAWSWRRLSSPFIRNKALSILEGGQLL